MNMPTDARIVDLDSAALNKLYPASIGLLDEKRDAKEALTLNRLSIVLQTTIEIPQILQLFYREVSRVLMLEGINFCNKQSEFQFELGHPTEFFSYYRVQTNSDYLGELILYHREAMLRSDQLIKLDRLVSTLVFPLRNGLRYYEAIKASLTDGLTGMGNRISMDAMLTEKTAQAHRYNHPLSLLVVDLDYFKQINDTYGHGVGDLVLKTLAQTLQATSRGADTVFRYGGEEFVVVLSNTDVVGAKISAERLRQAIENIRINFEGVWIPLTASVGVASLCHGETKENLLERADRALYVAKAEGRNRISMADPTLAHA